MIVVLSSEYCHKPNSTTTQLQLQQQVQKQQQQKQQDIQQAGLHCVKLLVLLESLGLIRFQ